MLNIVRDFAKDQLIDIQRAVEEVRKEFANKAIEELLFFTFLNCCEEIQKINRHNPDDPDHLATTAYCKNHSRRSKCNKLSKKKHCPMMNAIQK